jgi:putative ABC transport system permease protein
MLVRWRLAVRLARRDAARHPGRSALVVTLIALPVALLAGGVTLWATTERSPDQRATALMGTADGLLAFPDGTVSDTAWRGDLPAGARAVPLDTSRPIGVRSGAERHEVVFTGAVLGDPLTDGLVDLVAGRPPVRPGEAALSLPLVEELGVAVGDELHLADLEAGLRVTGLVERPSDLGARDVVVVPGTMPGQLHRRQWLIDAGPAGLHGVRAAIGAVPSGMMADPDVGLVTSRGQIGAGRTEALDMLAVFGGLALTEAAIVASAAFAVGVRRQLRSLGLLAAGGGRRRDLRRVVLAGGLTLGSLGALLGAVLGVAAIAVLTPFLDGLFDRRVGALSIPWRLVAAAALAGMVAALAAAAAPARTAGRVPVNAALAGHRPVTKVTRRGLAAGAVAVAVGLAVIAARTGSPQARLMEPSSLLAVTAGSILVVLGFTFASPSMVGLLGRLADRTPTGPRLALRDLARHRARSGPAMSAVMAALALPIAAGTFLASADAFADRRPPALAPEHVLVETSSPDAAEPDPGRVDAVAEAVDATSRVTITELFPPDSRFAREATPAHAEAAVETTLDGEVGHRTVPLTAVDDVATALDAWGVDDDQRVAATEALERGGILWFGVNALHNRDATIRSGRDILDKRPVTGVRAGTYTGLPGAIVTRDTAQDLGLRLANERVLLLTAEPLDDEARAAAVAAAGDTGHTSPDHAPADDDAVTLGWHRPTGYWPAMGWRLIALGVSTAVAAGIVVVALSLSAVEGRAERATLAAVGADRVMRRRFRAAQALALTLAAGVLAIPAGFLPSAVTLMARYPMYPLRLPWEAVGVALLGLPVLAWTVTMLLAREDDTTRRAGA